MTYEDLIVALAGEAPQLHEAALRIILELVATSIQNGTPELVVSSRALATKTDLSREGVMRGLRELDRLIATTVQHGKDIRISLPAHWFEPQRSLFLANTDRAKLSNRPTHQASTGQTTSPPLAKSPGQLANSPGQYWPTDLATTGQVSRPIGQLTRPDRPTDLASSGESPIRNAHARVDRSIDPDSANTKLILLIDRALRTVEIMDSQRQDAEILSETLQEYRNTLVEADGFNSQPDETVLARILAIAPLEELCGVLRKLMYERVRPGRQDMWFFTVLMQKIHGASPKLTASRYDALKGRKPPMTETLPNFGPQLMERVAAGIPRF